ncbi:MAG: hypothetical protein JST48_10890 [Bacteroidetes bacterium]|nr:hypothetical protein [Bacteroidota bacterium]
MSKERDRGTRERGASYEWSEARTERTRAGVIFCVTTFHSKTNSQNENPKSIFQKAKSMTARSPDDSAGEHNKGSRWTASVPTEGGSNETE